MDYLDPIKKRKHRQRIAIGYIVIGLIIAGMTFVTLLIGFGYWFNTETREIVQNGLLFVDTKHRSSVVELNGKQYGETSLRLTIPEGQYSLVASRDSYRQWRRDIVIEGGELSRMTYGLLVPEVLEPEKITNLQALPVRALQSQKQGSIITWSPESKNVVSFFDISKRPAIRQNLSLEGLLSSLASSNQDGNDNNTEKIKGIDDLEFIEFDRENRRVLTKVNSGGAVYYWIIDTQDVSLSVNITKLLPVAYQANTSLEFSLIDGNPFNYYVFDRSGREVYTAEIQNTSETVTLQTIADVKGGILDFKGYSKDWMIFVSDNNDDDNSDHVNVFFKRGDTVVLLRKIKKSEHYFLELTSNMGKPVIGIGSSDGSSIFVYSDSIDDLIVRSSDSSGLGIVATPSVVLPIKNTENVLLSPDSSIVMAYNASRAVSYDFTAKEISYAKLDLSSDGINSLKWLSGQQYSYVQDGVAFMVDFDGSNKQELTHASSVGIFYREDSRGYFSFHQDDQADNLVVDQSSTGNIVQSYGLFFVSLLAPSDL